MSEAGGAPIPTYTALLQRLFLLPPPTPTTPPAAPLYLTRLCNNTHRDILTRRATWSTGSHYRRFRRMAVSVASSTLNMLEPGGTTRGRVVHALISASMLPNDLADAYLCLLFTVVFSKFMHCLLGVYLYVHATRDSRFRLRLNLRVSSISRYRLLLWSVGSSSSRFPSTSTSSLDGRRSSGLWCVFFRLRRARAQRPSNTI